MFNLKENFTEAAIKLLRTLFESPIQVTFNLEIGLFLIYSDVGFLILIDVSAAEIGMQKFAKQQIEPSIQGKNKNKKYIINVLLVESSMKKYLIIFQYHRWIFCT